MHGNCLCKLDINMKSFNFDVVLNREFGGFGISQEMALWLVSNKNWPVVDMDDFDWNNQEKYPINCLIIWDNKKYSTVHDRNIEFRSHPDLIECVKAIQELHKNDEFANSDKIHDLHIQNVKVDLDVDDYHDGKEAVTGYVSAY